jgi:hypothetical protein
MADFLEEDFSFEFESEVLIKSSWAGVGPALNSGGACNNVS